MLKIKLLLITILMTLFIVGCGTSSSEPSGGSSAVALGQFGKDTSLTAETSQVLELVMTNTGFSPQNFEIKVGQGYILKVTNNSSRQRFVICNRHGVNEVVAPGETITTAPFSDQELGHVAKGLERSSGSKPQWKFKITVVE